VITEAAHLLRHTPGGTSRLLDLCNGKDIAILSLSASDIAGIGEVLNQYHDQNLDLADACLMHLANREFIRNIFTIDQRHFSIFRASDGRVLNIVP
jgi:predicted nucleic acid-binding protein